MEKTAVATLGWSCVWGIWILSPVIRRIHPYTPSFCVAHSAEAICHRVQVLTESIEWVMQTRLGYMSAQPVVFAMANGSKNPCHASARVGKKQLAWTCILIRRCVVCDSYISQPGYMSESGYAANRLHLLHD